MSPTSPVATAAAGAEFETEIGALYLAALLLVGPARGVPGGVVNRVGFQRAAVGAPLDDIVVMANGAVGPARLDLQVKRTLTFAQSDREFGPVIDACWDTFRLPNDCGASRRLGVGIAHFPARVKEHYVRVPEWARTSSSARSFFDRVSTQHFASEEMRAFVRRVATRLREYAGEEATEEEIWQFFRTLEILDFDFTRQASRDRTFTIEALRAAVPDGDTTAASNLWHHLTAAVRAAAVTGGEFTAESLRERLRSEQIALVTAPSVREDLERLTAHSRRVLSDIDVNIAGLVLDRSTIVAEILGRVDKGDVVLITGAPGVGKSGVLKAIASVRQQEGPVIALGAERLNGVVGWDGLAERLQLQRSPEELVAGLSGAARPCLVIDGVDRVEGDGPRRAINDLLRAIDRASRTPDGAAPWSVVLTARAEMMEVVREWLSLPGATAHTFRVPELEEGEVATLAERLPHLKSVLEDERVGDVARNLYLLRVLEDVRTRDEEQRLAGPTSEAAVWQVWWEHVIGRGGVTGRERQAAMLRIGESALRSRARRVRIDETNAATLYGLESDAILRRDPGSDTYWFGHDILEEWTAARVLAGAPDPVTRLRSLNEPFWAARALQLVACALLEAPNGAPRWVEVLEETEANGLSQRWAEAVLSAPLRSARIGELLDRIGEKLLIDSGRRLAALLRILRTSAVTPDPRVETLLQGDLLKDHRVAPERRRSLVLEYSLPDLAVWLPVLVWLIPRLRELPGGARAEAARVMEAWFRVPVPNLRFRREMAEAALDWFSADDQPRGSAELLSLNSETFDRLRDVIVQAADLLPDRVCAFLQQLVARGDHHRLVLWLARSPHPALALYTPSAYADFALDLLVPNWRESAGDGGNQEQRKLGAFSMGHGSHDDDPIGIRSLHGFVHPSHLRGPFLLLLQTAESEGLRLVNTLVNAQAAVWRRQQRRWQNGAEPPSVMVHVGDDTRRYWGDGQVYRWFRPTSSAPFVVTSALMALEVWMEKQIEAGRNPEALFQTVLRGSDCQAVLGVCVAVALAFPDKCLRAALPLICMGAIWDWDIARYTTDSLGTIFTSEMYGLTPDAAELAARKRDTRPQRNSEIRDLVWRYVFSTDEALRNAVVNAIQNFPSDLGPLTEDERANPAEVAALRRHMEDYVGFADARNYRPIRLPDGRFALQYHQPTEIEARHAGSAAQYAQWNEYLALEQWARKTREAGKPAQGLTLSVAIERAQAIEQPNDFTAPPATTERYFAVTRLQAIVGVALTALEVDPPLVQAENHLPWCRRVLVGAAAVPKDPELPYNTGADALVPMAARGLMALLRHGLADEESRLAAFTLLRDESATVVDAILDQVRSIWTCDLVFARNAVARELALAAWQPPSWSLDEAERARRELEAHAQHDALEAELLQNVRTGRLPDTIGLADLAERGGFFGDYTTTRVERALRAVPLDLIALGSEELPWVLEVTYVVLRWTMERIPEDERERSYTTHRPYPYGWPAFLGDWLAWLTGVLPETETEQRFFNPLRDSWPRTAELTAELLAGLTRHQLASNPTSDRVRRQWRSVASWVLPAEPLPSWYRSWLCEGNRESLELLLHVRHERAVLTDEWYGASDYVDLYDRWVASVGHTHWGFRALIAFASAAGRRLAPERIIDWLASASARAQQRTVLWSERSTGAVTAQLIARLLDESGDTIRRNPDTLSRVATLLEELARAGVPLAAALRSSL